MKTITHSSATPLRAFIITFCLLMAAVVFMIATKVSAIDATPTGEGRLVTIHDRGTKTVVLSSALTIGEALEQAGVTLDKSDAVEPAASETMVASEYEINIYRARPVIVIDGATKQKVITPYQTGEQIAKSAGITLQSEDTTTLSRTNDIVSEGAGLKLTIDRATPLTFDLYGTVSEIRTQGQTVGDMLAEKGITLSDKDRVVPGVDTVITTGMSAKLWREGKQTITATEPVAFVTDEIQDGDQYVGYRAVKSAGVAGSRNVTYEIVIADGQVVSRVEIASMTTLEPVKQVEIVGAKNRGAYTTPTENETITWNFLMTQGFSREQTAGIMGNLKQEHGFNTTGDGLAQWTGSRKAKLFAMTDPENIYTQLEFLMIELNGGYSKVRDAIKASDSVEESVRIFQNQFERCGICVEDRRILYAFNILASH